MAAILKFKMAATRGVSELGPNRKMIIQGSSISVPIFIISPQSEIFFDLTAGLRRPSVHRRRSTMDDVVRRRCGGGRTDGVNLVGEKRSEVSRRVIVKDVAGGFT